MKEFATLIKILDSTNKTNVKVDALTHYFKIASDEDKVWTIALLSHRRPSRPVNTTLLREWANELSNMPYWLFEESYHIVGDLAETIALIIPTNEVSSNKSLRDFLEEIIALKGKSDDQKKEYLQSNWLSMGYYERFVFTKLITGGFRIGVSQKLMTKALSKATLIDEEILAYKLMGNWNPSIITFKELVLDEKNSDFLSKPYPFFLAYALETDLSLLGNPQDWAIEHKWDGIRAQIIIRNNDVFVWSRGEELVTDKYPEFQSFIEHIENGTVLDGEILVEKDNEIGSFNDLQTRIGRKKIDAALLKKTPVILKVYDLLEYQGNDIRKLSYRERREQLEKLMKNLETKNLPIALSQQISFSSWEKVAKERLQARIIKSEGLMLKHKNSTYQVGRKKGDWWKWKLEPLTIDAVLTYAMRGHGRRSNLFTDYTFALWQTNEKGEKELVTFAKAYSGLTDEEFKKVDDYIKKNTLDKYGPVRSVVPKLVFEIAFEGVSLSKRHKSGVATRFPRILRWRTDKKIEDANSLEDLKSLIS